MAPLAAALALGTAVAFALYALVTPSIPPALAAPGILWPDPRPLQPFQLEDSRGRAYTREDLTGHWTFLAFGYTSCPDVCPLTLAELVRLRALVDREGDELPAVRFAFLSVDPQRDTAERLGEYVRYFDPEFIGLRAPDADLVTLTGQLGVYFHRDAPHADGGYQVQHSATIALSDPDARVQALLPMPHDAGRMLRVFSQLAARVD